MTKVASLRSRRAALPRSPGVVLRSRLGGIARKGASIAGDRAVALLTREREARDATRRDAMRENREGRVEREGRLEREGRERGQGREASQASRSRSARSAMTS